MRGWWSAVLVAVVGGVTFPASGASADWTNRKASPDALTVAGGRVHWVEQSGDGGDAGFELFSRRLSGGPVRSRRLVLARPGEIRVFGLDSEHEASGPTVLGVRGARAWVDAAWCTNYYGQHSSGCVSTTGGDTVTEFNRRSGRRILTRRGRGASVIPGSPTALGQALPDGRVRITDPLGRLRPVVAPRKVRELQVAGRFVMWVKGSSGSAYGTRRAAAGAFAPDEAGGWTTLEVFDRRTGRRVYRRSADDLAGPSGAARFLVLPPKLDATGAVGLELIQRDDLTGSSGRRTDRPLRSVSPTWVDPTGRVRTIGRRRLGPIDISAMPDGARLLVQSQGATRRCTGVWVSDASGARSAPIRAWGEFEPPVLDGVQLSNGYAVTVDDALEIRTRRLPSLAPTPLLPRCPSR